MFTNEYSAGYADGYAGRTPVLNGDDTDEEYMRGYDDGTDDAYIDAGY